MEERDSLPQSTTDNAQQPTEQRQHLGRNEEDEGLQVARKIDDETAQKSCLAILNESSTRSCLSLPPLYYNYHRNSNGVSLFCESGKKHEFGKKVAIN